MIGFCKKHGYFSTPTLDDTKDRCPRCIEDDRLKAMEAQPSVRIGAIDLAKYHDFTAATELDASHHRAVLRSVKVWPHVDYSVIVDEMSQRYRAVHMEMLGIDATGVGEPIAEMFRKNGVVTMDIKFGEYVDWTNPWSLREHAPVKLAMVEYARACMQSGFVEMPDQGTEELRLQLAEQEIKPGVSDRIQYQHPEGRHDDLAWAFMINLYVARRHITGTEGWIKTAESVARKP